MRDMRHVPQKYSTGIIVNYLHNGKQCAGKLLMFDTNDCTYLIRIDDELNLWVAQENIICDLEHVIDVMIAL